jgi:hypothetical protein
MQKGDAETQKACGLQDIFSRFVLDSLSSTVTELDEERSFATASRIEDGASGDYMAVQLHPPPAGAYGSSPLLTGPHTEGTR